MMAIDGNVADAGQRDRQYDAIDEATRIGSSTLHSEATQAGLYDAQVSATAQAKAVIRHMGTVQIGRL